MTTAPVAGRLEAYGFEEVEPGIVADTSANRALIRSLEGHWNWETVWDEDGAYRGLIRVLDPDERLRRREEVWDRRRDIMVDPDDRWSDYVHPDYYPMDADVPYFIGERLQKWKRKANEGVPEEERQPFPARCVHIRTDETRCWAWAANPQKIDRCKWHTAWKDEADLRNAQVARIKLLTAGPQMADNLEYLALHAEGEAVRLKATTEVLDRIGVRAGMDLTVEATVTLDDPAIEVKTRLDKLATRVIKQRELEQAIEARAQEENTVDAEVISDSSD